MRAFASFKGGTWCMDLAYVDELAEDNNGVKYLLVRRRCKGNKDKRLEGNSQDITKNDYQKE